MHFRHGWILEFKFIWIQSHSYLLCLLLASLLDGSSSYDNLQQLHTYTLLDSRSAQQSLLDLVVTSENSHVLILEPIAVAKGEEYADGKILDYMSISEVAVYPDSVCPEIKTGWFKITV